MSPARISHQARRRAGGRTATISRRTCEPGDQPQRGEIHAGNRAHCSQRRRWPSYRGKRRLRFLSRFPSWLFSSCCLAALVRDRAEAQEKAFGRLAAQFSDRIRTLPTILANHALQREHGKIEQRMTLYADSTMGVLKVAFLNAGIIDFFSALAIAVLAVFLGLGHLGLVHVPGFSRSGALAEPVHSDHRRRILHAVPPLCRAVSRQGRGPGRGQGARLVFRRRRRPRAGNAMPFTCRRRLRHVGSSCMAGLIAISGPSGAGKSTLLRMLAGIETPPPDFRSLPQTDGRGCDWISTDIYVPAGTLGEAIAWNRGILSGAELLRERPSTSACSTNGSCPAGSMPASPKAATTSPAGNACALASPASCFPAAWLLPTSRPPSSIRKTAKLVRQVLTEIAKQRLVIVATHDERADRSGQPAFRPAIPIQAEAGGCRMSIRSIAPHRWPQRACIGIACAPRSPWRLAIVLADRGLGLRNPAHRHIRLVPRRGGAGGPRTGRACFQFSYSGGLRAAVRDEQDARQIWRTRRGTSRRPARSGEAARAACSPRWRRPRPPARRVGNSAIRTGCPIIWKTSRTSITRACASACRRQFCWRALPLLAAATAWLAPLALVPIALVSLAMTLTLHRLLPRRGPAMENGAILATERAGRLHGRRAGRGGAAAGRARLSGHPGHAPLAISARRKPAGLPSVARLPGSTCWPGLPVRWRRSACSSRPGTPASAARPFSFRPLSGSAGLRSARPRMACRGSCLERCGSAPPAKASGTGPRRPPENNASALAGDAARAWY